MTHEHNHDCKNLLGNLSDYIDGDLDERLCQELQAHMAGCENCRVVFDTMSRTIYLYQNSDVVPTELRVKNAQLPSAVRERLFSTLKLDDLLKPTP